MVQFHNENTKRTYYGVCSFFMPKYNHKEENSMNDIERRFYSEPETRSIPVGHLSTMKNIFQKILSDIKEENPYATISELLDEPTNEPVKYGNVSEL